MLSCWQHDLGESGWFCSPEVWNSLVEIFRRGLFFWVFLKNYIFAELQNVKTNRWKFIVRGVKEFLCSLSPKKWLDRKITWKLLFPGLLYLWHQNLSWEEELLRAPLEFRFICRTPTKACSCTNLRKEWGADREVMLIYSLKSSNCAVFPLQGTFSPAQE